MFTSSIPFRFTSAVLILISPYLFKSFPHPLLCCHALTIPNNNRINNNRHVTTKICSTNGINGDVPNGRQSGYDTNDEYQRFLYSKKRKQRMDRFRKRITKYQREVESNEDGYSDMMKSGRPLWRRALLLPLKVAGKLAQKVTRRLPEPGTLILIRHGESEWNANKTFTGWADPDLSQQGYREVEHAAR